MTQPLQWTYIARLGYELYNEDSYFTQLYTVLLLLSLYGPAEPVITIDSIKAAIQILEGVVEDLKHTI